MRSEGGGLAGDRTVAEEVLLQVSLCEGRGEGGGGDKGGERFGKGMFQPLFVGSCMYIEA